MGAEGTEAEAEAAAARGDPAWRGRTFAACGAGVAPLSAGVLSLFLQGGLYPHGSVAHFAARVREAVAGGADLAMLSDHLSNPRLSSHIPVPMGGDPVARAWTWSTCGRACAPCSGRRSSPGRARRRSRRTYMCALFAVSGAARIEARPLAFWRAAARLVDGSLPPCTGPARLPRDVFMAKLRKRDAEAVARDDTRRAVSAGAALPAARADRHAGSPRDGANARQRRKSQRSKKDKSLNGLGTHSRWLAVVDCTSP